MFIQTELKEYHICMYKGTQKRKRSTLQDSIQLNFDVCTLTSSSYSSVMRLRG